MRRVAVLALLGIGIAVLALLALRPAAPAATAAFELAPVNAGGPVGLAHLRHEGDRLTGWRVVWGLGPGSRHRNHLSGPGASCPVEPPPSAVRAVALPDLVADENGVAFGRVDLRTERPVLERGHLLMVYAQPSTSRGNARVSCGAPAGEARLTPAQLTALGPGAAARADVSTIVQVRDGRPIGGVQRIEARQGDTVALALRADLADELRIEGYDLVQQVGPGTIARFTFPAERAGQFAIAGATTRGRPVAVLVVRPRVRG